MQISKKHRQMYIFILILFLIAIQIVNNKASMEAVDIIKSAASNENYTLIRGEYFTAFYGKLIIVYGLGWFVQQPITNLFILLVTIILFNKKIANRWLETVAVDRKIQFSGMLIMLASLYTPTSDGFLVCQVLFVFMLFAFFYPKFDKVKSRRFYAFRQIRKTKNKYQ